MTNRRSTANLILIATASAIVASFPRLGFAASLHDLSCENDGNKFRVSLQDVSAALMIGGFTGLLDGDGSGWTEGMSSSFYMSIKEVGIHASLEDFEGHERFSSKVTKAGEVLATLAGARKGDLLRGSGFIRSTLKGGLRGHRASPLDVKDLSGHRGSFAVCGDRLRTSATWGNHVFQASGQLDHHVFSLWDYRTSSGHTGMLNFSGEVVDADLVWVPGIQEGTGQNRGTSVTFLNTLGDSSRSGSLNLKVNSADIVGSFSYQRHEDRLSIEAALNGERLWYDQQETPSGRDQHLFLTRKDGRTAIWNTPELNAIAHGDIHMLLDLIERDFGNEADFLVRWGSDDDRHFLSFDIQTRLLQSNAGHHDIRLRLAPDGFLQFNSSDGRLHLTVGAPHGQTLPLHVANYSDDQISINLDNTFLRADREARIVSLETDQSYLVQLHGEDFDVETQAEAALQAIRDGDLTEAEQDQLLRDILREIRINSRELSKGHLSFADPRWEELLSDLAWDVGEFFMSDDSLIQVIRAEDQSEQLYIFLQSLLPGDLSSAFLDQERSLWYTLGVSILEAPASSTSALGITGFATPVSASFAGAQTDPRPPTGLLWFGSQVGTLQVTAPLFGKYSRTALAVSAPAEQYYLSFANEVLAASPMAVSLEGLVYAYRFPSGLSVSLHDGYIRQFSLNGAPRTLWGYATEGVWDLEHEMGIVVPGALAGVRLTSPDGRWSTRLRVMPYVPIELKTDSFAVDIQGLDQLQDPASFYQAFRLATDLRGGLQGHLFGRPVHLEFGKDVNGYLTLAPEAHVSDALRFGIELDGRQLGDPQVVKPHIGGNWFGINSTVFLQQNAHNKTDLAGISLSRTISSHLWNISAGMSHWENAGRRERVETYLSCGVRMPSNVALSGSLFLNDVTRSTGYHISYAFPMDQRGDTSLALDAGVVDNLDRTSVDLKVRGQIRF